MRLQMRRTHTLITVLSSAEKPGPVRFVRSPLTKPDELIIFSNQDESITCYYSSYSDGSIIIIANA